MPNTGLCRKERICGLGVVAVIIVVLVLLRIPTSQHKGTGTRTKSVSGDQVQNKLGYPSVLYDCFTNLTDSLGSVRIPESESLGRMSHGELTCLYFSYLSNIQVLCRLKERLGNIQDGGWDACIEDGYRPVKPCLVYSVGINNDFTFDDAVNRKYGCEVHSYDPSMGKKDHMHAQNMYFHATGLAPYNMKLPSGWRMRTLDFLRNESDSGMKRRPLDILKMDIEGMEWDVLPEMIANKSHLGVKQLYVEFHSVFKKRERYYYEPSREYFLKYLRVLRLVFQAGFRIFWTNKNFACKYVSKYGPHRTACYEVYFVQTIK